MTRMRAAVMASPFTACLFLLTLILPLRAQETDRPAYIHCQSNSECARGQCCLLGAMRYSVPSCRAMQQEGEYCRPNAEPLRNTTIGYPDGSQLNLKDAHFILCPCNDGLSCNSKKGICTSDNRELNRVSDDSSKQHD